MIIETIAFGLTVTLFIVVKKSKKKNIYRRKARTRNRINKNWEIMNKPVLMSVSDIAIYFNISSRKLNTILEQLKWQTKSERWITPTKYGLKHGAEEKYNAKTKQKYILWDSKLKYNKKLIYEIDKLKDNKIIKSNSKDEYSTIKKTKPKKMSNKEKKEKGDLYETYISNFFKEQGYFVWEVGKEKGVKDSGVDIFIKKDKIIYFVQCKNWETWKLNHDTVQATQTKVRNFMKQEKGLTKLANGFKKKILYVTPKRCLTKGAYKYIEENSNILEYQVIAMN